MKKTILILALLFTTLLISQEKYFVRAEFDPKLAIIGAYDHDKTPVADITISLITQVKNNELGVIVEYVNLDPYYFSFGFLYNRKVNIFNTSKVATLLGCEIDWLQRGFHPTTQREWIIGGVNGELRWFPINNLGVTSRLGYKWRRDYNTTVLSGSIGLVYVFKNN